MPAAIPLLIIFILAMIPPRVQAEARPKLPTSCPTTQQELSKWMTDSLNGMYAPSSVANISTRIKDCNFSDSMKTQFYSQCVESVVAHAKHHESGTHLHLTVGTPDPESDKFRLPQAFLDKELVEAIGKFEEDDKESRTKLDAALSGLQQKFPTAKIFEFKSGTINRNSVVTVLPGEKEDLYVHAHQDKLGYLAFRIRKKSNEGKPIDPPLVDFIAQDNIGFPPTHLHDRCISCHRGGSVAIVPIDGKFLSHTPGMTGEQMKKWWNDFRTTNISHSRINLNNLAPEIGPEDPPGRTLEFVKACSKKDIPVITDAKAEKIRAKMNCVGCHTEDGKLDRLKYPMHTADFGSRVLDNIILQGHMPSGADKEGAPGFLSMEERRALLNCLKTEYFGRLGDSEPQSEEPGIYLNHFLNLCKLPAAQQSPISPEGVPAHK